MAAVEWRSGNCYDLRVKGQFPKWMKEGKYPKCSEEVGKGEGLIVPAKVISSIYVSIGTGNTSGLIHPSHHMSHIKSSDHILQIPFSNPLMSNDIQK